MRGQDNLWIRVDEVLIVLIYDSLWDAKEQNNHH